MMIIKTINTAMIMIPSVEPASSRSDASTAVTVVPACMVGVAVASWTTGGVRLSARLVNSIANPSITQNAMRIV